MDAQHDPASERSTREGWSVPQPETLPRPTYWPAVFALGAVLILWGFVTTLVISGVGGLLFLVALGGWIGEMRHERRT